LSDLILLARDNMCWMDCSIVVAFDATGLVSVIRFHRLGSGSLKIDFDVRDIRATVRLGFTCVSCRPSVFTFHLEVINMYVEKKRM
jgi:hypothetical protein